jgi:hypothetical protein
MTDIKIIRAALNPTPPTPTYLSAVQQADFNLIHSEQFEKTKPDWINHYTPTDKRQFAHRHTIIKALASNPADQTAVTLALKIFNCNKPIRLRCGSPFCPYCRSLLQQTAVNNAQQIFSVSRNNHLSFLTILLPVTYTPDADAVAQAIVKCRKQIQYIFAKNNFSHIKFYGFAEVDIKLAPLVKNQSRAPEVLKELGFDITNNQPAYLVHLHAIVDLSNSSESAFRQSLLNAYPGYYQVLFKPFHTNKTKQKNIQYITNYMLKFLTVHADNIHADDVDEEADYTYFFEEQHIIDYVKLIHGLLPDKQTRSIKISKNC